MTYRFVSDRALRIGQIVLLFEAIVRGLNYIATPDYSSPTYTQMELSAPLTFWGVLYIALGVLGLFGEALLAGDPNPPEVIRNGRAWPSFIAHVGLMVLFIGLTLSASVGVFDRETLYGFVSPYDFLVFAVGHWVFARRRKNA